MSDVTHASEDYVQRRISEVIAKLSGITAQDIEDFKAYDPTALDGTRFAHDVAKGTVVGVSDTFWFRLNENATKDEDYAFVWRTDFVPTAGLLNLVALNQRSHETLDALPESVKKDLLAGVPTSDDLTDATKLTPVYSRWIVCAAGKPDPALAVTYDKGKGEWAYTRQGVPMGSAAGSGDDLRVDFGSGVYAIRSIVGYRLGTAEDAPILIKVTENVVGAKATYELPEPVRNTLLSTTFTDADAGKAADAKAVGEAMEGKVDAYEELYFTVGVWDDTSEEDGRAEVQAGVPVSNFIPHGLSPEYTFVFREEDYSWAFVKGDQKYEGVAGYGDLVYTYPYGEDERATLKIVKYSTRTDNKTDTAPKAAELTPSAKAALFAGAVIGSTSTTLKNRDCALVAYTEGMTFSFEQMSGLRSFEVIVTGCVKDGAINWPAVTYRGESADLIPEDGDNHWTFAEQQDGSFAVTRRVANTFTIGE